MVGLSAGNGLWCSTSNAVPPTLSTYEKNEQIINEIYLSTIAKGIYAFDATQKSSIDAIADNCPIVSGPCTFRARSLRKLYVPNAIYNDVALCHQVGISYRTKPKTEVITTTPIYKIYPNPASTNFTIETSSIFTKETNISIIDVLGNIVYTTFCNDKQNITNIDVSNLISGLYFVKINNSLSSESFISKITIFK